MRAFTLSCYHGSFLLFEFRVLGLLFIEFDVVEVEATLATGGHHVIVAKLYGLINEIALHSAMLYHLIVIMPLSHNSRFLPRLFLMCFDFLGSKVCRLGSFVVLWLDSILPLYGLQ